MLRPFLSFLDRAAPHVPAALTVWLRASFGLMLAAALVSVLASYGAGQSRWLGHSLTWWRDLTAACHASLLFFAASQVLARAGHLRIDLLYARWSPRTQAKAERAFAWMASLPLMLLLLTTALPWAWRAWSRLEASVNPTGLGPLYLVKSLLVLASVHGLFVTLRAMFARTAAVADRPEPSGV